MSVSGHRLILHIGAPKCASSSLQSALSGHPELVSRSGERFRYAAIRNEGWIMVGEALRRFAAAATCRYAVSADGNVLATLDDATIARLADELNALLADSSVILSCESWISSAQAFADSRFFERIAHDCEVIAYVRPQADFVNACWWQWAAWTDIDFDVWLYFTGYGKTCAWFDFLRSWSALDGVSKVSPRLLSGDILPDFFDAIGCDFVTSAHRNKSLPEAALRFLQRNRELRTGMGDSDMDFILERALGNWAEPAPWVLPFDFVTALVGQCRLQNEALAEMLPATERSAMLADPRWWDASFYRDRRVAPASITTSDLKDIDALAVALAKALQRAEHTISALQERIP